LTRRPHPSWTKLKARELPRHGRRRAFLAPVVLLLASLPLILLSQTGIAAPRARLLPPLPGVAHVPPPPRTVGLLAPALADLTCGTRPTAPTQYEHVIWIWFENHSLSSVIGSPDAPFITSLAQGCGYGTAWMDNILDTESAPQYIAATAGANCSSNTLHPKAPKHDRCVTTDAAPAASCKDVRCRGTISTSSIFEQVRAAGGTWKSYQEGMPANCATANPSGSYFVKHNPPAYFSHLRINGKFDNNSCAANDIPFPNTACDGSACSVAAGPNSLADDLALGSLPTFSFVTPNICNDMHDACSPYASAVLNGDHWLQTWMPRILSSPSYQAGTTAVFVMWDEGTFGAPIPNVVVAPSVTAGTVVGDTVNNIAALRATENMLGVPYLNCASGTQGDGSPCPSGSTADLRTLFGI
jgi:hypothetical protein